MGKRGFWRCTVLGVWLNIKQNPGAGCKVAYSKHEAPPLFTWTGLGDKKDRHVPQGQQGTFLLLISSSLGNFTLQRSIALFTCFCPSFQRKQLSAIVLNWRALLPGIPILVYLILDVFILRFPIPIPLSYTGGLCPVDLLLFTQTWVCSSCGFLILYVLLTHRCRLREFLNYSPQFCKWSWG